MKNKFRTFFVWLKSLSVKKVILITIALIIAILGIISLVFKNDITIRDIYEIKKSDVSKTVLASGKVVSETDLSLSFQKSDIVKSINVKVGDKVKAGTVLASLSNASDFANLTRAKGTLLGAEARYRKILEGAGNADVVAAEDALKNAINTQDRLVENARRTLFSADLIAEPSKTDMDSSNAPTISGVYLGQSETSYNLFLEQSNKTMSFTGPERGDITVLTLKQPFGTKGLYITFPTASYSFSDEWVINIPNKNGKNYTANLNAYNAAVANREEVLGAAKSKIDILKTAARKSDVDAALADVLVAKAGVASAEAELEKTIVRAPSDGTITKIDIKLGDLAQSNSPVITLQDVSNLYIESNVNEADIVGVKVGQPVDITFEAFGKDKIYSGEISLVNIGATTNNSVVNYKVKAILKDIENIRSGMTADIKISTFKMEDVIAIPSRYIGEEGNGHYVYIVEDEKKAKVRKQIIQKGEIADGGIVVILNGLNVNDKIALVEQTK